MVGDQQHIHDPEKAAGFYYFGTNGWWPPSICWRLASQRALCIPFWQIQGASIFLQYSESDRLKDIYNPINPGESNQKYSPWNRDDPKIPEDIRQKLIRLEERNESNANTLCPCPETCLDPKISS